jgi:hypothetical protein
MSDRLWKYSSGGSRPRAKPLVRSHGDQSHLRWATLAAAIPLLLIALCVAWAVAGVRVTKPIGTARRQRRMSLTVRRRT